MRRAQVFDEGRVYGNARVYGAIVDWCDAATIEREACAVIYVRERNGRVVERCLVAFINHEGKQ